jgi:hypothetical protein
VVSLNTRESRFGLGCALLLGMLFAVVNVPFGFREEVTHLAGAYALSRGVLRPQHVAGQSFHRGPAEYALANAQYADVLHGEGVRVDVPALWESLTTRHSSEEEASFAANAGLATPLSYLPYLPALWFARLFDLSVLWHLYLARAAGVLTYGLLGSLAIVLAERASWLVLALVLAPATLFHASAVSASGLTNALALLFAALLVRTARTPSPTRRQRVGLSVLVLLLGCCSPPALLFAAALVPVGADSTRGNSAGLRLASGTLLLGVLIIGGWHLLAYNPLPESNGQLVSKLVWPFAHPAGALRLVTTTLVRRTDETLMELLAAVHQTTSQLRFMGAAVSAAYGTLLFSASCGALNVGGAFARGASLARWLLVAALATALATVLGAHLSAKDAPARTLAGLDGATLIPALVCLAVAAALGLRPFAARWLTLGLGNRLLIPLVLINLYSVVSLFGRYYATEKLQFPY